MKRKFGFNFTIYIKSIILLLLIFWSGVAWTQSFDSEITKANNLAFEKDYVAALQLYNHLLTELNDSVDLANVYGYAAVCAEKLEDDTIAYNYFKKAVAYGTFEESVYNKLYAMATNQNDVDCQEYVLTRKLLVFPSQHKKTLKRLAYLFANNQQYINLLDVSEELMDCEPDNSEYYYLNGIALINLDKPDEAEKRLLTAIKIKPDDYASNMALGLLWFNQASKAFDREQARYEKIKNPSMDDYLVYFNEMKKVKVIYIKAEPYLLKACQIKCNDSLQKALDIIEKRKSEIKGKV